MAWRYGLLPSDRKRDRMKQKIQLARYARMDIYAWEHRPVSELNAAYDALRELLKEEGALTRAGEEH